jgi:hypothetical protein
MILIDKANEESSLPVVPVRLQYDQWILGTKNWWKNNTKLLDYYCSYPAKIRKVSMLLVIKVE